METELRTPMGRRLLLREMTKPGQDGRAWEVEEDSTGLQFLVDLTGRALHGTPEGWAPLPGDPDEEAILQAVGLAVDNACMVLRDDPTPGERIAVNVNSQEVYEARERVARNRGHSQP